MKRFFCRLTVSLIRDDLFLRVLFAVAGLLSGGLGVAMLAFGLTFSCASLPLLMLYWLFAILFTTLGGLMLPRCALPAHSRLARFWDRHLPDGTGEEALFLLLVVYLPAVLFTLVLRFIGVRGQRTKTRL